MDDAFVARSELDGPDEPRSVDGNRDHEIAEDVEAVRGKREGLRALDDEVRLAELPALRPFRRRRQSGGIAFDCALFDPQADRVDLFGREPTLPEELDIANFG